MYLPDGEIEKGALRQGDVVSQIHLLGAINPGAVQFTTDSHDKKIGWCIPNTPMVGDAMVLSHSCEIAVENGVKVTSIILAPLRDLNTATDPKKKEELISTNLIDADRTTASYLKYFYLEPNQKLEFSKGAVVDFSKCFSVRKNFLETLTKRKILQLVSETRDKMAFKLAAYFYRTGNDLQKAALAYQ